MWLLKSSKGAVYYLLSGKDIVVGRKDGDLVLADDQSISRRHAVITVEHDNKNLTDPSKVPVVTLTDTNAKYGTFINGGVNDACRVASNSKRVLKHGDVIQFGVQWNEWKLEYVPLVVTTSTLTPDEKNNLKQHIITLGGHIVSSWQDGVTHVTMCSITLTVKVVCALAVGKSIVTPQYWGDYVLAVSTQQTPPACASYIPPLAETTLNANEVSFDVNEKRKKLFSGKHFVFFSLSQFSNYSCMVTAAGGKASVLDHNEISREDLAQPHVIVMQYSLNKHSEDSQASQSFQEVAKYLKSKGKRVIPDSEIGLAILHCSTGKNCNPKFNIASTLISKENKEIDRQIVLALDTQDSDLESLKKSKMAGKDIIIPESGTVPKPSSSSTAKTTVETGNSSTSKKGASVTSVGKIKMEQISIDEIDASLNPRKRMRSLEDDGFLRKRTSRISAANLSVETNALKLEPVVKEESDNEDLFEFPSDKKCKTSRSKLLDDDDDEELFKFSDEEEVKSADVFTRKEQLPQPVEVSKKRKSLSSDADPESSSVSKKRAIEINVQQNETGACSSGFIVANKTNQQISLKGFLNISHKEKDAVKDESMIGLSEGLKSVTVVDVKPLISHNTKSCPYIGDTSSSYQHSRNFKKFRKVQAVNCPIIRKRDMVPCDVDTKGFGERLDGTHNNDGKVEDDDDDDDDDNWAFFEHSQTKKQGKVRGR